MVARAAGQGKAALLILTLTCSPALGLDTVELTLLTRQGSLTYFVEIARSTEDRSKGLMFREELPKDHGMLFDFDREQPVAFWMKNTPLSLDLLFIDANGEIVGLTERAVPFSEDLIPSRRPVRYVLEILGGSAEQRGIRIGDRLGPPLFPER